MRFYTVSVAERDGAAPLGYLYDGVACYVHDTQILGTVPFYRLASTSEHFYTASEDERDSAITQSGYHVEGIACYVYNTQIPGTVPFYRLASTSDHLYTASEDERNSAITQYGYHVEGIACYVFATQALGRIPFYRLTLVGNLGELEKVMLSNVHFDLEHAMMGTPQVENVSIQDLTNGTDVEQRETFTFELDYTETRSWSTTFSIKGGIETNIKAGIPFIDGGIKISAEIGSSTTWGTEETIDRKYSAEIPVTVPPHTHVICRASASVSKVTVSYSADAIYHFSQGQDIPGNFTGVYEGATTNLLQASWSTPQSI